MNAKSLTWALYSVKGLRHCEALSSSALMWAYYVPHTLREGQTKAETKHGASPQGVGVFIGCTTSDSAPAAPLCGLSTWRWKGGRAFWIWSHTSKAWDMGKCRAHMDN